MRSISCGCSAHHWTLQYRGRAWSSCYRRSPQSGLHARARPVVAGCGGLSPDDACPAIRIIEK
eukprot:10083749-Prorocentrum_lima.AAC.1